MALKDQELTDSLIKNNVPIAAPGMDNVIKKTWFLEDENQNIVAVDEASAWNMMQPSHTNTGYKPRYRILGVSMGYEYQKGAALAAKMPAGDERRAVLLKAFDDELSVARGNIERPRNPNMRDNKGNFQTDPNMRLSK